MPDKIKDEDKLINCVIDGKYRVDKPIGSGAFGQLFSGVNIETQEIIAIKMEEKDSEAPQLPLEYRFYVLLGEHQNLPKVYHFGPIRFHHALVLELLGPSLEQMFELCASKFSVLTTAKIGKQIIETIEYVHSKRIVFRDVKPENFLLGQRGSFKANTIHMIDFGLAKEYIDMRTGKHIAMKTGKLLIGTPRYMSTWTHRGKEHGRRDDLESIGFMLIYFLKGRLPWQGLKGKHRYERIGEIKMETPIDQLCIGLPQQFAQYCSYIRGLDFEAQPDYNQLKELFNSMIIPEANFDWDQ